jgi:hypothetical protein
MQGIARASAVQREGAGRQRLIAWLALSFAVGLVVILYLALSLSASADPLLMPLDDTYIHFQYARQFARGESLTYYPGDPATSGGTSLIYPPLLALGYALGFTGWSLVYWALAIGIACFFGAAWLVYLIGRNNPLVSGGDHRHGYALWLALAFVFSGPLIWAALSGMETALFVFTVLLTLYALQTDRFWLVILAATLTTLTRPEGLILAGVAVVWLVVRLSRPGRTRRLVWLAVPLLAGLVQPLINILATGSPSSSGMQAKSHLYNTSAPLSARIEEILRFFGRMWRELLSGRSPDFGTYTSPLLAEAALAVLVIGTWIAWRKRRLNVTVLALVWILVLTAGVATLDTAFWQFKRYQLPVMALFFPAAAWTSALLGDVFERRIRIRWARWGLPVLILIPALFTTITFARNYAENVIIVRDQQVPMARWVKTNLPKDARIGVHDVGLMGYFSGRALYDVVGLTTPGPATSWRQGPGAIYEYMAGSDYRPDYFAIYPDVQGLRYVLDAGVFGEVLAEFPVDLGQHNVASAADYQAVYAADWSNTRGEEIVAQTTTLDYLARVDGVALVDQVDVANLESEADHDYHWWNDQTPRGFATEVYHLPYRACGLADEADCWATDGGRVLTGGEEFTLETIPGQDMLLVTRVHGRDSVLLDVFMNDERLAGRVQSAVPGRWVEVVTWVPGDRITGTKVRVRLEAQAADGRTYMPYYHWAFQGTFVPRAGDAVAPVAAFGENQQVRLLDYNVRLDPKSVDVRLTWLGDAPGTGDGIVFVHLYNHDNVNTDPVAQTVTRPAGDVLAPGNWLPGMIDDAYTVSLPDDLPPGDYVVAIGLFDALTGMRYPVSSDEMTVDDNRLFIGEVTIEESASEN